MKPTMVAVKINDNILAGSMGEGVNALNNGGVNGSSALGKRRSGSFDFDFEEEEEE